MMPDLRPSGLSQCTPYLRYKNQLADCISRGNFDAFLGESWEFLAKEGFQRMDV